MIQFNLSDILTEEDASKIFFRTREHGLVGFHQWCLDELIIPNEVKIRSAIGDFDADYLAYSIEAAAVKAEKAVLKECNEKARNNGGISAASETIAECTYWWPRAKETDAGITSTMW
jgi:hypothetical protein